jgi:nicotinamide-nucleotide amidase
MPTRAHLDQIVALLAQRNETVAVAESITAGGVGRSLTSVPGASKVFLGGIIAYTNEVKVNLLGINPGMIDQFTAVSEEVASAMADGARDRLGATWALATTGIAGPGDYQGIAEGTVWISIRGPINESLRLHLDGGREAVRTGAISSAIGTFARILSSQEK